MTEKMEGEKAVEIFGLVVKNKMLPAKLEKLVPLSFIGQAAVSFYRAKVKAMTDLGMTEEQQKATLSDGQDAGKMLLAVEARIGELLPPEEETRKTGAHGGARRTLPDSFGDTKDKRVHRASQARMIHRNPAAVDAVIKEAEENGDIPTKTAVINRIRYEQEKARVKNETKSRLIFSVQQSKYINVLEQILALLPKVPPKDWSEDSFKKASGLAQIIINRLEGFVNAESTKVLSE